MNNVRLSLGDTKKLKQALQRSRLLPVNPDGSTIIFNSSRQLQAVSGSAGINQLTTDVNAGPGTGPQAATVVGIRGHSVPIPSTGFLQWTGSAFAFSSASPNFADNETVTITAGSGTLAHTPNPAGSLILVQILASFGGVVLINGTNYTLAGSTITITSGGGGITPATVQAWYRY